MSVQWVAGRYRVDGELGTGGSATVYLVHDAMADRPAALKLISPSRSAPERAERLRAEARTLAALDHPHVVKVLERGVHEDRDYLVMEYFERGSLAGRLAGEGPLPPREAVQAVGQVLEALGAAHAAGIVHRDVKPANVLVRADGSVALADFGIARTDDDAGDTRTGVALGSVPFMAPEQRVDSRRAGPEADLYAAACCLYNLLTGDTPIDLHLASDASPRWEPVPAPLRPILRQATQEEASRRFRDAAEMARALDAVLPMLAEAPAGARPKTLPPPGYAPTQDERPTEADRRDRLRGDDWRIASRRAAPVGRTAIWVGAIVILVATATFVRLGPLAERGTAPVLTTTPQLAGRWEGTVNGQPARLELRGGERLEGEFVLERGVDADRIKVQGVWKDGALDLTDLDSPRTFHAELHPSGLILEGEVRTEGEAPIPFAWVRVE